MKRHLSSAGLHVGWVFACGMVFFAAAPRLAADDPQEPMPVEAAVHAALEAEVAGDATRRDELLKRALTIDPENGPARWQSGFVRAENEWLSVDEVARRWAADERLAEYRRLRNEQSGTPTGELALARWCRNQNLDDEARIHWLRLLLFQPQNEEALKNLGMRWHNGELLSVEQIRQRREGRSGDDGNAATVPCALGREQPPTESESRHWRPLVAGWRRAVEDEDTEIMASVRQAVVAAGPSQGIASLDWIVCQACELKKEQEAYQKLSALLVDVLEEIADPWAMQSLCRYAVFHPAPEIREAAADALKNRPQEDVVPWLLAAMRWPVEASFVVLTHPDGSVTYQHSFYREGLHADYVVTRSESTYIGTGPSVVSADPGQEDLAAATVIADRLRLAKAASHASSAARAGTALTATARQRQADEAALRDARLNQRIGAVLARVTGENLQPHPKAWTAWWEERCYDYYELEKPKRSATKPVYENYFAKTKRLEFSPPSAHVRTRPTGSSCFPRGTLIWTLIGPATIETIRPGDRVLAQHPLTGELAYKPVLQTTTRDPSPMIKVGFGSETIAATRGHPFWVAGIGWQMAKQLDAGLLLHSLSGPVPVGSVEEAPPAKAWYDFSYNLIVDDFHTYFVGQNRVLVHDNQLYANDQVDNPLPGLAK